MSFTLKDFTGVIPAYITPFDKNEKYDPAAARETIEWLLAQGVGGLYLTGSTGFGAVMDTDERKRVVESVCELVNGRVPLVAHIAAVSSKASADLARHAKAAGCTGVSAVPSYYYKLNEEQMVRYYSEIAEATDLPLVIYAQCSVYTPSVPLFERLGAIPNVKGLKYTGSDHYTMGRIKKALGEDFMVYSGMDEMFLSGLIFGADAVIGSTYNVIPDLVKQGMELYYAGDIFAARTKLLLANDIVQCLLKYDLWGSMKVCQQQMGLNAGYDPAPFGVMSEDAKAAFLAELRAIKTSAPDTDIALFRAL